MASGTKNHAIHTWVCARESLARRQTVGRVDPAAIKVAIRWGGSRLRHWDTVV